ncbi:MAG: MerR family transcriptional regulator [Firmicutes bacterium]|nr:MerR family transcriptional regulator [Bacillota bacterium]
MKKNKKYFTTGEFARIFGIKKQTLFHYDQCGIFRPDVTGENGYRYYSFAQLETFAVLSMLRELDVSIAEIKEHMDRRSPESLISLLESKQSQVDSKIAYLQWSKKYIETKLRTTREGISAPIGRIIFENAPDKLMVTTDYKGPDDEKHIMEAVGDHFSFCHSLGLYSAYPIGAIIHASSVTDNGYKYARFYTVVNSDELQQAGVTEAVHGSGGNYLAIYDNQGYTNIHSCCLKLLEYGRSHNLKLGDHFYEDVILDDLSTDGYYNYLVKVSVRVE